MGNRQAFYEIVSQRGLTRERTDKLIYKYAFAGHNQELVSYAMDEETAYEELIFQLTPINWEEVRSDAMEGDIIMALAILVHYQDLSRSARNAKRDLLGCNDALHKRYNRACRNKEMWVYGLGTQIRELHASAWVEATIKRRWSGVAMTRKVAAEIVAFISG